MKAIGHSHVYCEMTMEKTANKDYAQWKCEHYSHYFDEISSDRNLTNSGVHTLKSEKYDIDLYVNNIDGADSSLPLLVFFNGAVSNREEKKGPFFSGVSLSNHLGLPSLSFSDPTVDNINELNLAWYAGSSAAPDLRDRIIFLINLFHRITNRKIILLGGSGGGFAALSIVDALMCPTIAIVWNPQTSITLYNQEAVSRYLKLAFKCPVEVDAYTYLSDNNIVHDLCHLRKNNNGRILYLQNRTDWHLKSHALPYANSQNYKITRNNGRWENNLSIYVGDFGVGHVAPSRDVLDKILKIYVENLDLSLPDGYIASEEMDSMSFTFSVDDFDVKVSKGDAEIVISTQINSRYPFKNPLFAFYVMYSGIKEIQEYSKNNTLKIDFRNLGADKLQVQAFVLDDGCRCFKKIELKL
ncbi:hypothetical protein PQU96_06100 [Vogesella sp. LYT5W]|uniref:Uncharacterized protein n=1 Tax=Vogesella margarita TaxID=2984199 RepID=A0ABT5IME7_9NEIS|nr:hypothetical protein [Vogesella margarita]MDC7713710.1 hypothetical protein [Vogesella margarita]